MPPPHVRKAIHFAHYKDLPGMFDWSLDPRSQLALLCLAAALAFWNNDLLFFMFALMAVCSGMAARN